MSLKFLVYKNYQKPASRKAGTNRAFSMDSASLESRCLTCITARRMHLNPCAGGKGMIG